MIRNALLAPIARAARRWIGAGAARWPERFSEYFLYALGWLVWPLDSLLRIPALAREASIDPAPRRLSVVCVSLARPGSGPKGETGRPRPAERVERILAEAKALLEPLQVALDVESAVSVEWPGDVPPPSCGLGALTGGFFAWASARSAGSPRLTVYFVEDLGPLAGCAVPGADWIVVDWHTDGTTVVHELGHLADLWPHDPDPDNLMTDRPGGEHAQVTRFQAAMIRTCRFAGPVSSRWRRSRRRDGS